MTRDSKADEIYSVPMGVTIKVLVGSLEQEFTIHKNLAIAKSDYFRTALSKQHGWQEAEQRTFEFAEENVTVFAGFVDYIYNGEVKYIESAPHSDVEMFLIESYLLGERLGCMGFRNDVLVMLKSIWKDGPSVDAIKVAFRESMEKSTMCRYLLDQCAWDASAPVRKAILEDTLEEDAAPGFREGFLKALVLRDEAVASALPAFTPYHPSFDLKYREHVVKDGE